LNTIQEITQVNASATYWPSETALHAPTKLCYTEHGSYSD